jgi:hypothetical protein
VRLSLIKLMAMVFLGLGLTPAHAVLLGNSTPDSNTTAPLDDPGWDRVGMVNGSSAVYLGDGFVLTARHVNAGDLTLGLNTYSFDASFSPQYLQTQSGPDQYADLVLFKIVDGPSMSLLPIYTGTAESGMTATYIGFGLDRGTEVAGQGWLWGTTQTKRWGQNMIDGALTIDSGEAFYDALISDFDRVGAGGSGLANESHAATGDSGGALFIKDAGVWKLAGIMTSVTQDGRSFYDANPMPGPPEPDVLVSVRLSAYNDWILTAIPEPNAGVLMIFGIAAVMIRLLVRNRK